MRMDIDDVPDPAEARAQIGNGSQKVSGSLRMTGRRNDCFSGKGDAMARHDVEEEEKAPRRHLFIRMHATGRSWRALH